MSLRGSPPLKCNAGRKQVSFSVRGSMSAVAERSSDAPAKLSSLFARDTELAALPRKRVLDSLLEQIALALRSELNAETEAGRLLVESLVRSLSVYFLDRFPEAASDAKSIGLMAKPMDNRRMARVTEFIDAHLNHNLTVTEMAAVACMSPAHFARSFKVTTGQSPHQFINRLRLQLAKRMLTAPHQPISDIALSTGFSSQSNFSRAFRAATGMTPGAYRMIRMGARSPA